ncbi:hypothetical protein SDC9_34595 [bioreactor metagenome]|jgi:RNA polymerase sigma factor (sigma-70 family)|uniref:RNA polymerase sigma factor 70 region 4 type 2 domain-containing protein n=1 Tax=bioreactor metagenome TaxID=1076179 RepID=A0A644VB32_9ZZZZ|nr:sigma-70 family RNA polymerase sigma factor [Paludibacter sp.]
MDNKYLTSNIYNLRDKFLAGDESAYADMYTLYAKDLYALGLWFGVQKEVIEDAIQDVFIEIYTRRDKLEKITNLKLYIITAFRNRLFLLAKKNTSINAEGEIKSDIEERDHLEYLIEQELIKEKQNKLDYLLSKLNENQREAIYYRFVEGLSCEDVAYVMNINYQSAKNLLHRAIKKLRSIELFTPTMLVVIFSQLIHF